ncbi:BTB/POZ domain [Trinorchestia longiramus]|nr:BTB/POZ domain [Trinorchestia longiramus]
MSVLLNYAYVTTSTAVKLYYARKPQLQEKLTTATGSNKKFRTVDLFCDVSVVCGSRVFPAHKLVLAASSPFFQHMLARQPQWAQPLNMMIVLQDIDSEDFEALLEYMYKGEASVPQNALSGLIRTAEQLQIRGLATGDSIAQLVKDNETMLAIADGGFISRGSDRSRAAFQCKKNVISQKKAQNIVAASQKINSSFNENLYEKSADSPAGFVNGIINRDLLGFENPDCDSEDVQNQNQPDDVEAHHSNEAPLEEAPENTDEDLFSSAVDETPSTINPEQNVDKTAPGKANQVNALKKRSLSDPIIECQPERTKQRKYSEREETKLSVRDDLQSTEYVAAPTAREDNALPGAAADVVKQEPLQDEDQPSLDVDASFSQDDSGGPGSASETRTKGDHFLDPQVWSIPRGEWNQWSTDASAPPVTFAEAPLPQEFAQFTAVEAGPSSSSSASSSSVAATGSSARESCGDSASVSQVERFPFNRPSLSVVPLEPPEDSAPSARINSYCVKLKAVNSSTSNEVDLESSAALNQGISNIAHNVQVSQHPEDLSSSTARTSVLTPQTTNGSYSIGRSGSSEEDVGICRSSSSLPHHGLARLPIMPWKCRRCSFATTDASIFSLHAQLCKNINQADPKPFKCNKCPYSAKSQSAFNYHQKTHSGVKPFACRFCSYRTILKRSLVVHLRTHTQEKPYACPLCSYRANQKSNLDTHMNRHLPKRVPR